MSSFTLLRSLRWITCVTCESNTGSNSSTKGRLDDMKHTMDDNDTLNTTTLETTTPMVVSKTIPPRVRRIFIEMRKKCEEKMKSDPPLETDLPYCHREPDIWGGCWPDTKAGEVSSISCPELPIFDINNVAHRQCTSNGTWVSNDQRSSGNYTMCHVDLTMEDENITHIYIFIGGFVVSIVTLLISLFIFYWLRQLRCDRITIHKNLFLSYVFTGISWLLYYVLVALDGEVLMTNPIWCRVLHFLCQYCTVCNFFWMFCEGLYLNTIMVYAFNPGRALVISCYIIGWGLPVMLTAVYAGIRNNNEIESLDCWFEESKLQWILFGPVVFSIVANALFLVNIVRLLVTKLRHMPEVAQTNDETIRLQFGALSVLQISNPLFSKHRTLSTWKATRATLILVPLLGLQFLLFPMRPSEGSSLDDVYHISLALFVSLQGAFVSVMYCFLNGEVISVIRRKYTQRRLMRKRSSLKSNSGPPGTAYTTIDHSSAQNNFCVMYKLRLSSHPLRNETGRFVDQESIETNDTVFSATRGT